MAHPPNVLKEREMSTASIAHARTTVERATVHFGDRGQGVLVPGSLILTAAHVIEWTHTGQMALGEDPLFIQPIVVHGGARLLVYPLAVEPVADLAILGAIDEQGDPQAAEAFEQFCEQTRPVRLATTEYPDDIPIPAHIFAHTGTWITGTVCQVQPRAAGLVLTPDAPILPGTSGSPVVTDQGRLLGIVSQAAVSAPGDDGRAGGASWVPIPRPHQAAPAWLVPRLCGRRTP
jgi:hypothetical protein